MSSSVNSEASRPPADSSRAAARTASTISARRARRRRAPAVSPRAPAVVERDVQDHARVARGALDGALQLAPHAVAQPLDAADGLEAYVLPVYLFEFEPQVALEHAHQRVHFEARALPVLGREGIERERAQAQT